MLRILNVGLRGATLASKFVLLFFLVIYLKPADLGLYGLIVTAVAYSGYLLGFEFYNYNVREILGCDNSKRGALIKDQIVLHLLLYLIFIPLLLFIFIFDFLPSNVSVFFFLILILEHLNQEIFRLLVALSMQVEASICLFFRQGLWSLLIVLLMYFNDIFRSVETVFWGWLIGSLISLLIGAFILYKVKLNGWYSKIDWNWIFIGLKVAVPLLIANLALNAISTIERYWFAVLQGAEVLGIYVFYLSLTASLISILDAGVFSFLYPKLVKLANNNNKKDFRFNMSKMLGQTVFVIFIFAVIVLLVVFIVVYFFDKIIYYQYINLLYIALMSISIHALGCAYNYGIYSFKGDLQIFYVNLSSLLVFILSVFLISSYSQLYAVPVAVFNSYVFSFFCKFKVYNSFLKS